LTLLVNYTAGVGSARSNLPVPHTDDTDAASIASGFSDASTADAGGSVYDLGQHSPAALFMSPSASFGENDVSGGYEPTMSPGAFQAAMAAGILAAQGPACTKSQEAAYASLDTPQNSGTGAVALDTATTPAARPDRTVAETTEASFTPSSIASNSVASAKPDLAASYDSAAVPVLHAASATPASKATAIADSAVSTAKAEAGSPGGMSTNVHHDSPSENSVAGMHAEAESESWSDQTRQADNKVQHSELVPAMPPSTDDVSPSALDIESIVNSEPASTQMAEIAEASDQAQSSAPGTELTSGVLPADAELSAAASAGPSVAAADSTAEPSASSAAATAGKGLFSAVSKRPAEVCGISIQLEWPYLYS